MNDSILMTWLARYALIVAADDQPSTIYHSRIDGLLMPNYEIHANRNRKP